MYMDYSGADSASRSMDDASSNMTAKIERLRADLAGAGPVGGEDSELAGAFREFTGLLVETAGHTMTTFDATGSGMTASLRNTRGADDATTTVMAGGDSSWA
ncbi:hypothetical protein [Microtetraspora sp. NBRC 13810]|uniref:hypothetical protein n=1 Tax=Microtetraspora sp. NBRC 13810 TaxID=3030990 RepID=UPI002557C540|nr:hypothetical protein [Microtetraspora sp. NBRC 13810]